MTNHFEFRECLAPTCRFRYPAPAEGAAIVRCPKCAADTTMVPPVSRESIPTSGAKREQPPQTVSHVVLDNLRSVFNVGSIFRTADGVGAARLHLCGITPTPANPRLAKTALGAEGAVPWTHYNNGLEAVRHLREQSIAILGLETGPKLGIDLRQNKPLDRIANCTCCRQRKCRDRSRDSGGVRFIAYLCRCMGRKAR